MTNAHHLLILCLLPSVVPHTLLNFFHFSLRFLILAFLFFYSTSTLLSQYCRVGSQERERPFLSLNLLFDFLYAMLRGHTQKSRRYCYCYYNPGVIRKFFETGVKCLPITFSFSSNIFYLRDCPHGFFQLSSQSIEICTKSV